MADNELSKLKRRELLELMVMISEENDQLRQENQELKQKLDEREALIENAGSIAEASMQMTEFFKAVQRTADCYLENVRKLGIRTDEDSEKLMKITKQEFIKESTDSKTDRDDISRKRHKKIKGLKYETKHCPDNAAEEGADKRE